MPGALGSRDVRATPTCGWCGSPVDERRLKWCGQKCRQAAWCMRGRSGVAADPATTGPLRFAKMLRKLFD